MTEPGNVVAPRNLRITAIVAAVVAVLQLAMGAMVTSGVHALQDVHGYIGYALFGVMVVAAVIAFRWRSAGGAGGAFMHAAGLAVLVLVQIGLAEMDLKWVHIVLGLITCAGIISLIAVVNKKRDAAPIA